MFGHEFIWPFHAFVVAHIATGSVGLFGIWVPILGRKGGKAHILVGKAFWASMLSTGAIAICMALLTLQDPVGTHPHVDAEPALIAGIFGWMMLYLAILTINLAWYGRLCVINRRQHAANRGAFNLFLQLAVTLAAANCLLQGLRLGQFLMVGISMVGFATAATNLRFITTREPAPSYWLKEHLKGLVGAGISVYTAFFAFGAVRLMPELALNPVLWAVPLVGGLGIILYHWFEIGRRRAPRAARLRPEAG